MRFRLNRTAVFFTFLLLLICLPAVFTQQGGGRQSLVSSNPLELMKKREYQEALKLLRSSLQAAQDSSNWRAFDTLAPHISNCWFALSRYDSACVFLESAIQTLT